LQEGDVSQEKEDKITQYALKVAATTEDHLQKVDLTSDVVVQNVVDPPTEQLQKFVEVEENTEQAAQKLDVAEEDDQDIHDVAEILVNQRMSEGHDQMDTQVNEQDENQTGFDLNVEDPSSDFNAKVYQDAQLEINDEVFQQTHGMVQDTQENLEIIVQNVQMNAHVETSFPHVVQLSVDLAPQASGFLPSIEFQLMAQQTPQQTPNPNFSTSTMESQTGKFLISPLPTPTALHSPPPTTKKKNTSKLPNISLFDSLDTFVTKEGPSKEKVEDSAPARSTKPSRAEKLNFRGFSISTKTHKIACMLAKWTNEVHAPGLVVDPLFFYDPTVFDSKPSSESGDSTP